MSATSAKVTDPVCGMSIDPASAAASGCAASFKADPAKYATAGV
ncbi:hypothetical protein [uncultured Microbacterium sp.]|nr:hypothetical protein [uncultured Microbacterium sp.]